MSSLGEKMSSLVGDPNGEGERAPAERATAAAAAPPPSCPPPPLPSPSCPPPPLLPPPPPPPRALDEALLLDRRARLWGRLWWGERRARLWGRLWGRLWWGDLQWASRRTSTWRATCGSSRRCSDCSSSSRLGTPNSRTCVCAACSQRVKPIAMPSGERLTTVS